MSNAILLTILITFMPLYTPVQYGPCSSPYSKPIAHGCAKPNGTGARCDPGYYGQFSRRTPDQPWKARCVRGPKTQ